MRGATVPPERFCPGGASPNPMSSCAKGSRTKVCNSGGILEATRASGPCLNSCSALRTGLASTIAAPPGATGWSSIRSGASTAMTRGDRFRRSPSSTSVGTNTFRIRTCGARSKTSPFCFTTRRTPSPPMSGCDRPTSISRGQYEQ